MVVIKTWMIRRKLKKVIVKGRNRLKVIKVRSLMKKAKLINHFLLELMKKIKVWISYAEMFIEI